MSTPVRTFRSIWFAIALATLPLAAQPVLQNSPSPASRPVPLAFTVDTPPTVTWTDPANGGSKSHVDTVTIKFNKAVNVTGSAFKLECPVGSPESFTVSPAPPGGAASFTLTTPQELPESTTCTVTVVASQIADLAGTHMAADVTFSFLVLAE